MFITFRFVNADVGPERPTGMSPIAKCVARPVDAVIPYKEGSDNEEEIARNLEGLTRGIQSMLRWEIFLGSTRDTQWEYRIRSTDC